ncbi:glycoside hydrolase family 53 protein [Pseudobacter ginsenosidimutans]|uniref:Arabinogalactan endo-beta-1,4-galactanase n=1 Tax=Pseudobacter ginsenosidimutans TaxID=661488 RepID=A0A4Q7N1E4_9BACT|nr:glycosyl hydrolase 53 family protein [Pseudobacter ginsenosidimutans]QEC44023.1 arabinogalactan endo-1,4-beta-galactosidase [Pseudobacter ginsenosidimutans]RZS75461.1 arabinogalactan endo-1,4-beta-galactosidase [Pseudobacter ginsenosidimutans]
MKYSFRLFSTGLFFALLFMTACNKNDGDAGSVTPPEEKVLYDWTKLVMGADLSSVNMVQANGGRYEDSGRAKDPYLLFRQYGCNSVRLRLFHNPAAPGGYSADGYCGLEDVVRSIRRAKDLGMAVNLDFHYSDTWADPGVQKIPAAWAGKSISVLKDSVYNYTIGVLEHLKALNLTPEMVQIGNEIQPGMLLPEGKITNNDFSSLAVLLNSGIKAVRDFSEQSTIKPLIILHPASAQVQQWWFNGITAAGVTDFDIIGISYYEEFTTVKLEPLKALIAQLKSTFNKKVLIVETNYQWTNASQDGVVYHEQTVLNGFEVSAAGQLAYHKALTQAVIDGGGMGVMVWEPAWISNAQNWGQELIAFFDFTGKALPGLQFMHQPYKF